MSNRILDDEEVRARLAAIAGSRNFVQAVETLNHVRPGGATLGSGSLRQWAKRHGASPGRRGRLDAVQAILDALPTNPSLSRCAIAVGEIRAAMGGVL